MRVCGERRRARPRVDLSPPDKASIHSVALDVLRDGHNRTSVLNDAVRITALIDVSGAFGRVSVTVTIYVQDHQHVHEPREIIAGVRP